MLPILVLFVFLASRRTEPARLARRGVQVVHGLDVRRADALQYELRNAVTPANLEGRVGQVEQQHPYVASVVGVHHPRADVDACAEIEFRVAVMLIASTLRHRRDVGSITA